MSKIIESRMEPLLHLAPLLQTNFVPAAVALTVLSLGVSWFLATRGSAKHILPENTDVSTKGKTSTIAFTHEQANHEASDQDFPGPIESLTNFDWESTEPIQYRAFKPLYNMTMSLQTVSVNDVVDIDKHYVERLNLRKSIMKDHPYETIAHVDGGQEAVREYYTWLVNSLLPTRFPTIFEMTENPANGKLELLNGATSEFLPMEPPSSPDETLRLIGSHVEEDLMFLLPTEEGDTVKVKAFLACFPNSFNPRKILDTDLRAIHRPVPGYKEKLEKSMDRWFIRLQLGKFYRRVNWAVVPYDTLYTPAGHHQTDRKAQRPIELNIDQSYVRSERQMFYRLPKSNAVILSVKQYLYSVRSIKEEGLGPELATAVDGLKLGNVPEIHFYKRAEEWGESLKRFLLS